MAKRGALLCRVSTKAQARSDRFGIPIQLEAGRAYAERSGIDVPEESVYIDAISGASETRESFYRLLTEADQYEAVIVYDIYRIGRDEELSHRFLRLLREAGLEVHSASKGGLVEEGLATSAEIMIAAEERRKIAQRTYGGRLALARQGKLPTGLQKFGYTHVRRDAVVIPSQAAFVARMYQEAATASYRELERRYNDEGVPTPSMVRDPNAERVAWRRTEIARILQDPTYKGEYHWHSRQGTFVIPVPAIVSEDVWELAQGKKPGPKSKSGWPLVSHIRCGLCGSPLNAYRRKKTYGWYEAYRCSSPANTGKPCELSLQNRSRIEAAVESELRRTLQDENELRNILEASMPEESPKHGSEIERLEGEDARWLEAYQAGAIDAAELTSYRKEIREKIRALAEPRPKQQVPVAFYRALVQEKDLRKLVASAGVLVTAYPDRLKIAIGATRSGIRPGRPKIVQD